MTLQDMYEAYAETHNITHQEARDQYLTGAISPFELFAAYLENEGIYGYTQSIITAFRVCYNLDNINDQQS